MENQIETGTKKMVKKEENSDRFSTIANDGDRKKPLEKAKRSIGSMFRRSVKVEISPADVENTECGQLAKPVNQEPSQLASSRNVMKKEETSDNWSTMAIPETPLSTSPCQQPSAENSRKKKILGRGTSQCSKKSECMDGVPSDMSVSLATTTAIDVPGTISTSLLKDANKAKRHATIESGPIEVNSIGASSPDTGRNKDFILKSGSEDNNDGGSDVDDEMYETGSSKQHHVEANHNDATDCGQFTCLDCAATFETNAAFKKYITSHPGYRRHKCTVCEKRFIRKQHFVEHIRIHTGEKPFGCLTCQKRFTQSNDLQRHNLIHTGERPFKCDICDKKFNRSGHLTVHKRFHSGNKPFKCDVCRKCFTQSGDLTKHKRIHTGKKPYKCDVCKKCFTESGSLKRHKRIHTGETPFKCLSCGLCFRHNCNLTKHKRTHHSDADASSQLDAPQKGMDQSSTIDACDPLDNSVNGRKILYKRKSIDCVVEKMARSNPDILNLVWSKQFTMELASAVARSGYNCILCVKKIQPQPFRDVMNLSNSLHTCLVEVGPDSKTLRLFSFGGMILPEKITDHGRFKSLAKLESKMTRVSQSEAMEMVNIFKHSEKNSGWYRSLRDGLKGESVITDYV